MKFTSPNNHNFYEESPLTEGDLKSAFGARKTLVQKELFSSVFELTTKSGSLEQIKLFRFKPERNKLDDEERLILKLFAKEDRDSSKKFIVQTGLFAGVVYHNSCQFNITTRYGKHFLNRMLNYVNDIYVDNQNTLAEQLDDTNEFQNIIAYLFIQSLERASVLGLPKTYQTLSQHGHKVRGKIDVNAHLKNNIPFTGKITTSYREQIYVQEIIDVLYACCLQLESNYGNAIKRKLLGVDQLLKQHYSGRYPQNSTIKKAKTHSVLSNPMFDGYKKVLGYAEIILKEKSLQLASDSNLSTKGYLFDIAQLFEVYLEKLLDRHFEDWYITGQEEINTYEPMFYGRKMFPDIVMRHKYSKDVIVLDAKFKSMLLRKQDIDRIDFYQIHSYIQYYQPHVLFGGLIYPLGKNINTTKAHSNNLFGQSQHNNGFVVDGISVDSSMSMHEIMESENAFLDRVDNLISKKKKTAYKKN
ncbi:McrC family protein [Zunongwangia sp.]|uniref:McrC family protein n=1 Tax=Zunongwangia sp. TaxID=1965325 RepID=UPI003AA82F37